MQEKALLAAAIKHILSNSHKTTSTLHIPIRKLLQTDCADIIEY